MYQKENVFNYSGEKNILLPITLEANPRWGKSELAYVLSGTVRLRTDAVLALVLLQVAVDLHIIYINIFKRKIE